jgi:hypothetical protein
VSELKPEIKAALSHREYFNQGGLKGFYPFSSRKSLMVYIVRSGVDTIAVFDGDIWHISDSDFHSLRTKEDLRLVKQVIGDHDAYSMFPVVPTLAAMDALLERLEVKEI